MDDVKDKIKGFVKKINNPFTSTSRFKGEGHRLGSAQDSAASPSPNNGTNSAQKKQGKIQPEQGDWRRLQQDRWERERGSSSQFQESHRSTSSIDNVAAVASKSSKVPNGSCEDRISESLQAQNIGLETSASLHVGSTNGTPSSADFDPFRPLIASSSSDGNSGGLEMFQCPVCGNWWRSEKEITAHVEECLNSSLQDNPPQTSCEDTGNPKGGEEQTKVALGILRSGGPSSATLDVMVRILSNITNDPDAEKFRKIRMSNPKIHDTVGMALGGVELLEAVGFELQTEGDEIWAAMERPSGDQIRIMKNVIAELATQTSEPALSDLSKEGQNSKDAVVKRKIDRQVRVFYAAPENLAAKIELPESFFELSAAELRQEAAARRKKLEDSQLLIPKSFREKKAAASKQRYKAAIIRIQFPDGVILQGMFLPWETTAAIYEFVSSSLNDPGTRFDLVAPLQSKNQILPACSDGIAKVPMLEEADLVPATLVKFQPLETELVEFTGLRTDLLAAIEPLSSRALPI